MPTPLAPDAQYLLLRSTPPASELALRRALQDALALAFGSTKAGMRVNVLWVEESDLGIEGTNTTTGASGKEGRALVRVDYGDDATRLLAAIVTSTSSPRLSLIKSSVFLPSLLVDSEEAL
ncbi:hypothetical protein C8R46DRAFT_1106605 [Mycena filopes]|nr:hypothetical protein C8R46DRAFT_1106605 [Mycena filopes]